MTVILKTIALMAAATMVVSIWTYGIVFVGYLPRAQWKESWIDWEFARVLSPIALAFLVCVYGALIGR